MYPGVFMQKTVCSWEDQSSVESHASSVLSVGVCGCQLLGVKQSWVWAVSFVLSCDSRLSTVCAVGGAGEFLLDLFSMLLHGLHLAYLLKAGWTGWAPVSECRRARGTADSRSSCALRHRNQLATDHSQPRLVPSASAQPWWPVPGCGRGHPSISPGAGTSRSMM